MRPVIALIAVAVAGLSRSCSPPAPARASPLRIAAVTGTSGMVLVPAGEFLMGCDRASDPLCESDESPARRLTLPEFRIDRDEVSNEAYSLCVESRSCTAPYHGPTPWESGACVARFDATGRAHHPVSCVSFAQADGFCAWAGKRLPSEAEWEKAARGTDGRRWPWGNEPADCAHAAIGCGDVESGTHPLDTSPFGARDMAGSVWEWTSSWYGPSQEYRVVRGSEFNASFPGVHDGRAANRFSLAPVNVSSRLGFRCAK